MGDLLAFADDLLILSSSIIEMATLLNEFKRVAKLTGLEVNLKKCELLLVEGHEMTEQESMMIGLKASKTVKYLGINLVAETKIFS